MADAVKVQVAVQAWRSRRGAQIGLAETGQHGLRLSYSKEVSFVVNYFRSSFFSYLKLFLIISQKENRTTLYRTIS